MQNQSKTIKSSQNRSLASIVESKSQKDDFDNTRSTHQTNIHQNMMNTPQNEDIAVKSSIKTSTFTNFEQQATFSEHEFSSYERIQGQLESTWKAMLDKDEYLKPNNSGHLAPILVDRIHARPGLVSQIFELKTSNTLHNPNFYRKPLETQQEFLLFGL